MMDLGFLFKKEKMYLNHFIKLIKVDLKKAQALDWDLSISSDIIRSHGGKIELSDSKFGGLKVLISLPF